MCLIDHLVISFVLDLKMELEFPDGSFGIPKLDGISLADYSELGEPF